jgi:hypothetical protein
MKNDHYYTTGQVATACRVSPRTVTKWCEKGLLDHVRLPDWAGKKNGGDRRIPRGPLLVFMRKYRLPLDIIGDGFSLLLVGLDKKEAARFAGYAGLTVHAAAGPFQAGAVIAANGTPDAAIVDAARLGAVEAASVVKAVRAAKVSRVAVVQGECGSGPAGDRTFQRPFDFQSLVDWIGVLVAAVEPPDVRSYVPRRRGQRQNIVGAAS